MHLMKRKGLSLKMPANEFEAREAARYASKTVTDKRLESLVNARLGVNLDIIFLFFCRFFLYSYLSFLLFVFYLMICL